MGSSWRYRHVAITPYSIGGFHGLPHTYFTGSHFASMDEPVNSHVGEKLRALIEVNRKKKSAQSAGPTFSQHLPSQVSPLYIQLDPIYYDCRVQLILMTFIRTSEMRGSR